MESEEHIELPTTTYQLAEQYQLGQPLALYNMHPRWIHFCQAVTRVLLIVMIFAVFFFLVPIIIFLYQYLILLDQHSKNLSNQIADLQWRFILGFPSIAISLIICFACVIIRNMIIRDIQASFLVCTEGVLSIRPKEVDVTHWNEVRGTLQGPGLGKRKSYKLFRIGRKPLIFGGAFENVESLADLVKQQISKRQ